MEIDQTPAGIVNVEKLQCAKSLDVILQIDFMLHTDWKDTIRNIVINGPRTPSISLLDGLEKIAH